MPANAFFSAEPSSMAELKRAANRVESAVDAFVMMNLTGTIDSKGRSMEGIDVIDRFTKICKKPCIGSSKWMIDAGLLCGVAQVSEEQADLAVEMVFDLFSGKSIEDMEITQNRNGRRIINIPTAQRLGIKLNPSAAVGTDIVFSE